MTYNNWLTALRQGRSYVSKRKSHLIDFAVNDTEGGTHGSEIQLTSPSHVRVEVNAAAYLDPIPDQAIRQIPFDWHPFWDLERGRVGDTRNVRAEVVVNGYPVAQQEIVADGTLRKLQFDVPILQSSWIAVRILPSSHTNPIFIIVGGNPSAPHGRVPNGAWLALTSVGRKRRRKSLSAICPRLRLPTITPERPTRNYSLHASWNRWTDLPEVL